MKLQQLSRATATPVSTVKFYLREGLLPPGRKLNATTAAYGRHHVERLELIRALRQVVGLGLDRVREVVVAVETLDPVRMMGRVQSIVLDLPGEPAGGEEGTARAPGEEAALAAGTDTPTSGTVWTGPGLRAQDVLEAMGWRPGTPESLRALDEQLATMAAWGLAPDLDTALVYARAADGVAEHELSARAPWAGLGLLPDREGGPGGGEARGGEAAADGAQPASGMPSADRMATYTAVGVHGYSRLLLRLLAVAQGSHARGLGREA